jgi:hypothetical protein
MNKSQALKEAVKRWGKDAVVIDERRNASTPAQREAARNARMELRGFITSSEDRRFFRPLDNELLFQSMRQRFKVGYHCGFFISVRGTGDTWEECFTNVN